MNTEVHAVRSSGEVRVVLALALLMLAAGIALGAFGAHALKARLSAHMLANWQTAVDYHTWNSLGAAILVVVSMQMPRLRGLVRWAMGLLLGAVCFAGSLYVYALTLWIPLVYLTPVGGSWMLLSWLGAAWCVWRRA